MKSLSIYLLAALFGIMAASSTRAFVINGHWNATATNPTTGPTGTPITLTWSLVPNGTAISAFSNRPSNLISYFDTLFPGGSGSNLQSRPWFTYVQQSFDRWSAVSGVTLMYEPADDGVAVGSALGSMNVRGDIRLGGLNIDGAGGTNASTGFVDAADITFETGDNAYFSNSSSNYRNLRNTLMHEIGHSLGLGHSDSNSAAFLMEAFSSSAYDGPQMDDIRGAQQQYGDVNERANGGAGNNSILNATSLGAISSGQTLVKGTHSTTGTLVLGDETDFLSVTNHNDADWFSFNVSGPSLLDLILTPVGSTYSERFTSSGSYSTTNPATASNLSLELYKLDGSNSVLLSSANANGIGQAESILDFSLLTAGSYFARITGTTDFVQLYTLSVGIEASSSTVPLAGDYNQDGAVDAADYVVWRSTVGQTGPGLLADGDGNQIVDHGDYAVWRSNFGSVQSGFGSGLATANVPEPGAISIVFALFLSLLSSQSRRRRAS